MKKLGYGLAALVAAGALGWWAIGPDWRGLISNMPSDNNVLFWTTDQRDAGFRMLDRVSFLIEARDIPAGEQIRPLPEGEPLDLGFNLDVLMESQRIAGLVVLQGGEIRLERYGLDFDREGRWTSFSVAKSVTSTLVGAAVKDGFINSLDDSVSTYVKGLAGSAYDDVTIRELLTMTSGVAWNEDYEDPGSDVALFSQHVSDDPDVANLVSYMRTLPRAHPPGQQWNYSTGETNLIGILVAEATGKTVSDYLSEKIWAPYGMEQKATWLIGPDGREISGCCIQAATRDFARFGQFILDGAVVGGERVVPDDWLAAATAWQADIGSPVDGYGYQWWTYEGAAFGARGIFGQAIFIDPERDLVIASNGNWTTAMGFQDGENPARTEFHRAVQRALDAEAGRAG
ncbi:MAG: serine hydrolase domain-containing protein [Pseudomonadota bacterium]